MRQGVPEGRSSEGYASFKQVIPWPWHVEVIPEVNVVGLVTKEAGVVPGSLGNYY